MIWLGGACCRVNFADKKSIIMISKNFDLVFSGGHTLECVNLCIDRDGKCLRPALAPAELKVAEGFRPLALLNTDNTYLVHKGSQLALMSADGNMAGPAVTLDSEPLCVAPGGDDSTITVMTRSTAYTLLRTTLQTVDVATTALPCIRAVAGVAVNATLPAVELSKVYSHGDNIAATDSSRLTTAAKNLYEDLDSNVRGTNRYWQPVLVRIRALGAGGSALFESEPQLVCHPVTPEWSGYLQLSAGSDGKTTNQLEVEVPTYSLHLHLPDAAAISPVAAYEVLTSPAIHHSDPTHRVAVAISRRAGTQTLCTVTFSPGVLDSPALAARPSRLISLIGKMQMIESPLVRIPYTELRAVSSIELPALAALSPDNAVKLLEKALATNVVPADEADTLFAAPNSFTASTMAAGADSILWSGIRVNRFEGHDISHFAAAVADMPWQAYTEVRFDDGSTVVRAASGASGAPVLLGPVLSYPSTRAVAITVAVAVTGQTLRKATFTLSRDPSGRRAVYVHPGMRPFELPAADGVYRVPDAVGEALVYNDRILLSNAAAPTTAIASIRVSDCRINALAEARFGQSSWDFGRVRYYVFTTRGIYLLSADGSRKSMSMSLIDNRVVDSPYAIAHTEKGLAAVASGDVVLINGSKITRIDDGSLPPVKALKWVHDCHELWCITDTATELICFDHGMHRYTLDMVFETEHHADTLVQQSTGRVYIASHKSPDGSRQRIKWRGTIEDHSWRCLALRSLWLYMGGSFNGLRISLRRASLLQQSPKPEIDMNVSGTLKAPLCRRVLLPPRLNLTLIVEGEVSADSKFFKFEIK